MNSNKITLCDLLKYSINEQRELFTFSTDGYMCVNKLTLIIDLVFRISKKLNELLLEGKLVNVNVGKLPNSYFRTLYHVRRYNEITRLCDEMRIKFNTAQDSYKKAKLYYDYTHYRGCLQNIITSDEFELISSYIKAMMGKERMSLRLVLDKIANEDIMLINTSVISNLFDHMDDIYTNIKLPTSLKINIGTYYEQYKNETNLNDYKYYYMFITPDYFNDSLPKAIKDFNKRYAFVFRLK